MTNTASALWGLPDPDTQSEFYADVPSKRLLAWIADTLAVTAISLGIVIATFGLGIFIFGLIFLVVDVIYRVVSLANRSATPGMRLTAIEIRKGSGEKLDFATAALHTIGYYISVTFFVIQVVSIILMLTGARRQSLTDLGLGTAAVNRAARG